MTILSKLETLIEYAKFGMHQVKYYRNKGETGELFFPRGIGYYNVANNDGWQKIATSIKGYAKQVGANGFLKDNYVTKVIDLPELTSIGGWSAYGGKALQIFKAPKLRYCNAGIWNGAEKLEYLELGAVTNFGTTDLSGCSALKEFVVGKGTTSSLFLFECPNLTQECLHKIIENYADMTGGQAPTFHVGGANILKVDKEHIAMLEEKNIFYQ
jgi:hypothetical protein